MDTQLIWETIYNFASARLLEEGWDVCSHNFALTVLGKNGLVIWINVPQLPDRQGF